MLVTLQSTMETRTRHLHVRFGDDDFDRLDTLVREMNRRSVVPQHRYTRSDAVRAAVSQMLCFFVKRPPGRDC